ncbi:MAG: DUF2637 domain-containing protein [Streptomycetales bacterium]
MRSGRRAHAFPLSVDGIEIVASLVLLADRRTGHRSGCLPWAALAAGTAASVAANVAVASGGPGDRRLARFRAAGRGEAAVRTAAASPTRTAPPSRIVPSAPKIVPSLRNSAGTITRRRPVPHPTWGTVPVSAAGTGTVRVSDAGRAR